MLRSWAVGSLRVRSCFLGSVNAAGKCCIGYYRQLDHGLRRKVILSIDSLHGAPLAAKQYARRCKLPSQATNAATYYTRYLDGLSAAWR